MIIEKKKIEIYSGIVQVHASKMLLKFSTTRKIR